VKPELKAIKEEEEEEIKERQEKIEKGEELDLEEMMKKQPKSVAKKEAEEVLDSDEEELKKKVDVYNSKDIDYQTNDKEILSGFQKYNLSVHLMAMNSDKLMPMAKFNEFFDVVCLGFTHSAYLTKGVEAILRKGGLLLVEKATYLVPKKKEERKELNTKLRGLIESKGLF
jgi:hypothetical protein